MRKVRIRSRVPGFRASKRGLEQQKKTEDAEERSE